MQNNCNSLLNCRGSLRCYGQMVSRKIIVPYRILHSTSYIHCDLVHVTWRAGGECRFSPLTFQGVLVAHLDARKVVCLRLTYYPLCFLSPHSTCTEEVQGQRSRHGAELPILHLLSILAAACFLFAVLGQLGDS